MGDTEGRYSIGAETILPYGYQKPNKVNKPNELEDVILPWGLAYVCKPKGAGGCYFKKMMTLY